MNGRSSSGSSCCSGVIIVAVVDVVDVVTPQSERVQGYASGHGTLKAMSWQPGL